MSRDTVPLSPASLRQVCPRPARDSIPAVEVRYSRVKVSIWLLLSLLVVLVAYGTSSSELSWQLLAGGGLGATGVAFLLPRWVRAGPMVIVRADGLVDHRPWHPLFVPWEEVTDIDLQPRSRTRPILCVALRNPVLLRVLWPSWSPGNVGYRGSALVFTDWLSDTDLESLYLSMRAARGADQ